MSRRLNRECPCEARGLLAPGPISLHSTTLEMFLDEGLGHGDHTDCCGSECKLFHLGAFP